MLQSRLLRVTPGLCPARGVSPVPRVLTVPCPHRSVSPLLCVLTVLCPHRSVSPSFHVPPAPSPVVTPASPARGEQSRGPAATQSSAGKAQWGYPRSPGIPRAPRGGGCAPGAPSRARVAQAGARPWAVTGQPRRPERPRVPAGSGLQPRESPRSPPAAGSHLPARAEQRQALLRSSTAGLRGWTHGLFFFLAEKRIKYTKMPRVEKRPSLSATPPGTRRPGAIAARGNREVAPQISLWFCSAPRPSDRTIRQLTPGL